MTPRLPILVDGRAFSLQQKGGVSQIWAKLLVTPVFRDSFDLALFLYPGHDKNIHLQESGLMQDAQVTRILSDIPPSDNHNHRTPASYAKREAAARQGLNGRQPAVVINTYYGESILPDCPRYLVVVHDFAHEDLPVLSTKPTTAAVVQRKVHSMEAASDIVYISGFTRGRALQLYPHLASRRDAIIYHGHDDASVPVLRQRGRFIHIGTRAAYKNFGVVLGAFQRLLPDHPGITLSLMGGEAADDAIKALVDTFPGRVTFATNVSDERIFREIAMADGFISASEYEGFGIPILNAMHLGTVPILSDIPIYREIAAHFGQFFRPDDQAGLERLILRVATSNARQKPNAYRPWQHVAQDYVDFIKGDP